MKRVLWSLVAFLALFMVTGDAEAGKRRYNGAPQTQSAFDPLDHMSHVWGYLPTPAIPMSGAFTFGYAMVFDSLRTHLKYNEELYPWEAFSNLNYVVPYLGTALGYAYRKNLPKICRQGPGSFTYHFREDSPYIIDRPVGAYALNAYYSICSGHAVSHSTLPARGYEYPVYPHDWSVTGR